MKNLVLNNKYDLLRRKLFVGETIKPSIIKKISKNKAIANIKGYNVIIKNENLNTSDVESPFVILGFNDKEKLILLKKIFISGFATNGTNINFLIEILKGKNIPINSSTLEIAKLLYNEYNSIDKKLLLKIFNLTKIVNVPEFILFLINSNIEYESIKYYLNQYKNVILLLNLFNKKKYDSDKKKVGILFNNFHNIIELLKKNSVLNKNLFSDLLKNIDGFELFLSHLILLNLKDKNSLIFLLLEEKSNEIVKFNIKKSKNNWRVKIEYMINNNKVNFILYYNLKELNIFIEPFNTRLFTLFKSEKDNLLKLLKKYIKNINITINNLTKEKHNFDLYV